MSNLEYILVVILIMTIATFITRIFPFVFFHKHKDRPIMDYVAKYTPPMVMTILVIYVLKDVDLTNNTGFYTLAATLLTVAVHVWKSNSLLSIFSGTFLYMFLLQM